jgi:predicted HTH domain antitoxin
MKGARIRAETSRADAERRMRSAIDDVMTGHISINDAHRNRKVSREALRAELSKRGWADPHSRVRRSS